MNGDYVQATRFEDCRQEDREAHRAIWSQIRKIDQSVNDVRMMVERARGAMLLIQAVVTLLASAGGVALFKLFGG